MRRETRRGWVSKISQKEKNNTYFLQYLSSRLKESSQFRKSCLKVARNNPELCEEEVEFKAVLVNLGLSFP